jgi:DNA invertase Pin-like site-specific DNA recombinase
MVYAKNKKTTLLGYFFNVPLDCSQTAYFNGGICMKIGYIRVSTAEQNTMRQEILLKELGVDEIFIDKASGKNTDRPELKRMLTYVRQGDTVIIESISRFARNTRDLLDLIAQLTTKQVEFISKKEAIDTTTPTGRFMLTVFGAVAELEREYILQRQQEGIAIAKKQGKYKGRKPIYHPDFDRIVSRWKSGDITAIEAMNRLKMKPSTFYRKVREIK